MNILFLTLVKIMDFNQPSIYTDLLLEFSNRGDYVYIVAPIEKRDNMMTSLRENGNTTLLQVKIGNYFNTGSVEKGITLLNLENLYLRAIKKYLNNVKFDLVIYSTPPITFGKVISYIKNKDNATSYLLLKDIFPQNAVDIEMMPANGIMHKYFRKKETNLYKISDYIGCMSRGNVSYLLANNNIDKRKVEICPNCIAIRDLEEEKSGISERGYFGIPVNDVVFVYGGNLGAPQGIDFIIECLKKNEIQHVGFIVIIGQGSHYDVLERWFKENKPKHSMLLNYLPREQYNILVSVCDVGLIFLDHRFTIPNFPSRLLSYMQAKIPVLAATDPNTDVGRVIEEGKFGYWCESNDSDSFISLMNNYLDTEARKQMGENGYKYLCNEYSSQKVYNIIMNHFD